MFAGLGQRIRGILDNLTRGISVSSFTSDNVAGGIKKNSAVPWMMSLSCFSQFMASSRQAVKLKGAVETAPFMEFMRR